MITKNEIIENENDGYHEHKKSIPFYLISRNLLANEPCLLFHLRNDFPLPDPPKDHAVPLCYPFKQDRIPLTLFVLIKYFEVNILSNTGKTVICFLSFHYIFL